MTETKPIIVTHVFKGDGDTCGRTHLTRGSVREHCPVSRAQHATRPEPPAWMVEVIERWGEPAAEPPIKDGQWQEVKLGHMLRRAWVWFPDGINHGVHVDHYVDRAEYRAWGRRRDKPNQTITWSTGLPPDLDMFAQLIPFVWPS